MSSSKRCAFRTDRCLRANTSRRVKAIGAKNSATRTAEQTSIARFWYLGGAASQVLHRFFKRDDVAFTHVLRPLGGAGE